MHLTDLCFLLFLFSVLGEVVARGEDGPVLTVLGAELSPFEAGGGSRGTAACEEADTSDPAN